MSCLDVKGLCKDFGGVRAVNNLSFSLEKGEILGLIGPNGAGKTTAFNMIAGYFPPDQGEIYFQGTPITGLRPWDVCRLGIARTFQLSKPFGELSLIENVMVGGFAETADRRLARQRAEEVLEADVDLLATACPYCLSMLEDGIKGLEVEKSPKVLDIVEMVASSLG